MTEGRDSPRRLIVWAIVAVAVAIVLGWLLYLSRSVLLLVYVSALFAIGFSPLVRMLERQRWLPIGCNVRLGLGVPPGVPINISSSGGGVTASRLSGGMLVSSSGGGVHLEHVSGSVRIHSSGGGISLDDVDGTLALNSSGGGIHGALGVSTVSANSSGGGVNLTFSEAPENVRVRSSGGVLGLLLLRARGQGQTQSQGDQQLVDAHVGYSSSLVWATRGCAPAT